MGNTNRGGVDVISEQVEIPTESWKETIKVYGQILVEGFEYGVEAMEVLLAPWTSEERWGAFLEFERLVPEKMEILTQIAPNWFEWCESV
jgi:hypothetical protein